MATNGLSLNPIPTLSLPPGHPNQPYTLPSLHGETIYIPCSKSATRLLVTGKETTNAFALVGSGGTFSPPIGFHYHHDAHDVFLCLQGQINVWANSHCRTMNPGDFASVPPGTIHQYQILGTHTEFLGLIVPGGWEEFFRFIGDPYTAGPLFPLSDPRDPFEVLIPRLKAAAEQFDMVPCPQHPQCDPHPWLDTDSHLPGSPSPYFLRHNTGPASMYAGTITRPLAGTAESNGRFSIACLEGSSHPNHSSSSLFPTSSSSSSAIKFTTTHHAFQVCEGAVTFTVDHVRKTLHVGETIYVPAGTAFGFEWASWVARMYGFANGVGIGEVLTKVGRGYKGGLLPERVEEVEGEGLEGLERVGRECGFVVC